MEESPGLGYGMFLRKGSESVAAGDLLLEIPWEACLSVPEALRDPLIAAALGRLQLAAGEGSELVVIAGALASAKLRHDRNTSGDFCNGFESFAASLDWEARSHVSRWTNSDLEVLRVAPAPPQRLPWSSSG